MKKFLARLAELAVAGFVAGAGSYIAQNGVDVSAAGLRGLAVAAVMAAYGAVVKGLGAEDRPTIK